MFVDKRGEIVANPIVATELQGYWMSDEHSNVHAQHDDDRVEDLREKYGENANLSVEELRDGAEQEGVEATSGMTKEELLEAIGPEHRHSSPA